MLRPAVCEKDKETALLVDEGPKGVDRHAHQTCGERSPRAYPLMVGVMALVFPFASIVSLTSPLSVPPPKLPRARQCCELEPGNGASFSETVGEDSVPSTSYLCWLARCDDDRRSAHHHQRQ